MAVMLFMTISAYAQTTVKGQVCDKFNGQTIDNAVIYLTADDLAYVTTTDTLGQFIVDFAERKDSITIKALHVAYEDCLTTVPFHDELSISMTPKSEVLDEVVVKADWITRSEGLSFVNVAAIPNVEKYQADKMLEQIPGIIRLEQGSYTLNGEAAVIYINGVRQNISATSLSNFLSSLPANAISSVKLVPVNTGQYTSSIKAVIDLKINNNIPLGYILQPVVYTKYKDNEIDDIGMDLFFMKKKSRWLIHHSLSYNNESLRSESIDSLIMGRQLYSSNQTDRDGRCNVINYQGSYSYKFKNENNFILDAFIYNDFAKTNSLWANGEMKSIEKRNSRNDLYNISASYSIPSDKKIFNGIINYSLSYGGRHADMDVMNGDDQFSSWTGKKNMEGWMNYLSATFHTDLQRMKFTYGAQVEYNSVWDSSQYDNLQVSLGTSRFKGSERLMSTFIQTRYRFFEGFGLQMGVRGEYTDYRYRMNAQRWVNTSFMDFFPSVMFNFDSSFYNGLLGMTSQIYRADFREMLPGLTKVNDYVYTKGNPNLKPTDAYMFFLYNTWFGFFQTNFTYLYGKDAMADVYQVNENAMIISKCNAADYHLLKMNVVLPFSFWGEQITGQIQFNTSYKKMINLRNGFQLPEGREKYYWKTSLDANVNYNPSDRWTVMVSARHIPEFQGSLYTANRLFMLNANMSYSLLKEKRLIVSAYINGLFGVDSNINNYFLDNRYFTREINRGPQLGITLKWKFNKGQDVGEEYRDYTPNMSRF